MKLKGYIFSRPFFEERVPQNVQNIVLRDYCKKKNIEFLLSSTEYAMENSSLILREIIEKYHLYDGIVFYSLLQMPTNRDERVKLYKKTLLNKKQIHYVLENLIVKNKKDFSELEKIFIIKTLFYKKKKNLNKKNKLRNFITPNHAKTKRNYLKRMINKKVECMQVSKKYGFDYWDGNRKYGYGGFKYIEGYNESLAKNIIKTYNLTNKSKVLDVGCGKGFLMQEIKNKLKNISIIGIDFSKYAKNNTINEIKKNIKIQDARKKLKFKNNFFDLVISINTLHNFKISEIHSSLSEIERVGKSKFICVESYRNELEQFNLQCWALTAETLIDTSSWKWLFKNSGYTGDYEFIYFK
jgi:sporadic carbohydrate cluster protein (TIGR04323 family)